MYAFGTIEKENDQSTTGKQNSTKVDRERKAKYPLELLHMT